MSVTPAEAVERHGNLPEESSSFVGRGREVAQVKVFLETKRLVTLTGAGGVGKSRLALQVARDAWARHPDGVWLVELAPIAVAVAVTDTALVPQTVTNVLGVKEQAGKPVQQSLLDWLKPKRLLLILDNCEHLIPACATLASDLLRTCSHVHILASSREPLNVAGEQTYRVPSLSLPDMRQAQTVESLNQHEAVRLFIERAKSVEASFLVTEGNALAVAEVCFHLDGIPLAIELAAARVRSLSVEQINTRLDQRFRLLTGGVRDTLPRQQTLRALIDWSYDLLTEQEKALLCRLSVFAGGWTLEAAEAVGVGEPVEDWEVLDLLKALVDKSLAEHARDGTRYRLLETIRQYAQERLGETGQTEAVRERHLAWCLGLAEEAAPQLMGPDQKPWLSRLETEHDNFRAALSWCEQKSAGGDAGVRLAVALGQFWNVRGDFSDGRKWLGSVLKRQDVTEPTTAKAKALFWSGNLAQYCGDYDEARALSEEGLAMSQALEYQQGIADCLSTLGNVASDQGDYASADDLLGRSLTLCRIAKDELGLANALASLGHVAERQGRFDMAWELYEESLAIRLKQGDQQGVAASFDNLGLVAQRQGRCAVARERLEQSVKISRELRDQQGIAASLNNLGNVACDEGKHEEARDLLGQSLALCQKLGDQRGIATALGNLGNVAHDEGDYQTARVRHSQSVQLSRQIGDPRGISIALGNLGNVACDEGKHEEARDLLGQSLALCQKLGDQRGIATALGNLGNVAWKQHQTARATYLFGATAELREKIGSSLTSAEQLDTDKRLASMCTTLGEEAFAAAWDAGRAMTLEQAVEYALSEDPTEPPSAIPSLNP